jgi:hypothetical protein
MGALREKMIAEMKLRNFAARTQKSYLAVMVGLAKVAGRYPNYSKSIGVDLNLCPPAVVALNKRYPRAGFRYGTVPIAAGCTAAPRV